MNLKRSLQPLEQYLSVWLFTLGTGKLIKGLNSSCNYITLYIGDFNMIPVFELSQEKTEQHWSLLRENLGASSSALQWANPFDINISFSLCSSILWSSDLPLSTTSCNITYWSENQFCLQNLYMSAPLFTKFIYVCSFSKFINVWIFCPSLTS